MRIVSLLPCAPEFLDVLQASNLLVGRSHEDDHPSTITNLPILTAPKTTFTTSEDVDRQVTAALTPSSGDICDPNASLYTLNETLLTLLKPSVIITQDICNVCAIDLNTVRRIANKMSPPPQVLTLNPICFEDVLANVMEVGQAIGRNEKAAEVVKGYRKRIQKVKEFALEKLDCISKATGRSIDDVRPNVAFLEWTTPIYLGGHWTPELIEIAGGVQKAQGVKSEGKGAGPSVRLDPEVVLQSDPDLVIICPCGLDLEMTKKEAGRMFELEWWKKFMEKSKQGKKNKRICFLDGNQYFNRPGPRLVDALEFLAGYIWNQVDLIPPGFVFEEYLPTPSPTNVALSFTGGKDSTLSFHILSETTKINLLICFGPSLATSKPFLAHPVDVIKLQAEALGVQFNYVEVGLNGQSVFDGYVEGLENFKKEGVDGFATGDIEDVPSDFIPRVCKATSLPLLRPLYKLSRDDILSKLKSFDVLITCVNTKKLGMDLAEKIVGKKLSQDTVDLISQVEGADICGEWGEYHTMVLDAPRFCKKVKVEGVRKLNDTGEFMYFEIGSVELVNK